MLGNLRPTRSVSQGPMEPMHNFLDFEQPIAELEGKIEELRHLSDDGEVNIADEVARLQAKAFCLERKVDRILVWGRDPDSAAKAAQERIAAFGRCSGSRTDA